MKFSLSTNWCNLRMESGEEIAEKAGELGFDGLELGFHTTELQVEGFRRRLDVMPVRSVHAFCPVPISAPQGYPELYQLASFDAEARKMAQIMIKRNIAFAADMGATALVLHAGRVPCEPPFAAVLPKALRERLRRRKRTERGRVMIDILRKELETLVPELEKFQVRLGLENLPYLEGFPNLAEVSSVCGDWVRPWLDTGHWYALEVEASRVARRTMKVTDHCTASDSRAFHDFHPLGIHLNDSNGGDDHLPPGEGKIDFALFKPMMEAAADHLVLEPNASVTEDRLREALKFLKSIDIIKP